MCEFTIICKVKGQIFNGNCEKKNEQQLLTMFDNDIKIENINKQMREI